MKPEILFKNVKQDDTNFCARPTLNTDCPQLPLTDTHLTNQPCSSPHSGSESETIQRTLDLALVLDWDLPANWQSKNPIGIYNIAYISYKHVIHAHLSVEALAFFAYKSYLLKPFRIMIPLKKTKPSKNMLSIKAPSGKPAWTL